MEEVARALAANSLRVVRFDFPYMREAAQDRQPDASPDAPAVLEQTWLAVVGELGEPSRLVIGGKSMGGRIASMVADRAGVKGLVCLGYPFHPTGRPQVLRVAHLKELKTPALFLQGERDAFGSREEIAGYDAVAGHPPGVPARRGPLLQAAQVLRPQLRGESGPGGPGDRQVLRHIVEYPPCRPRSSWWRTSRTSATR